MTPVSAVESEKSSDQSVGVLKTICLFALGFVVSAGLIHSVIGNPFRLYAAIRSEKLRLMESWRGRARSAAFGSSHVDQGFDPRVFDAVLRSTPLRTTTINLAIDGGSQAEQRAMALEFVKGLSPGGDSSATSLIMLELSAGANTIPRYLVHPRSINLYDFQTTKFVFALSDSQVGMKREVGRYLFALSAGCLHAMNVGMLSNEIFAPPLDERLLAEQSSNDRRGLHNLPLDDGDLSHVERALGVTKNIKPLTKSLLPGNYELLAEVLAASRVNNLNFVYFVAPLVTDLSGFPTFPASLDGPNGTVPIINLARPDKYPNLYTAKYWHDTGHLNEAGARLATSILADELRKWYIAHPSALHHQG